MSTWREYFRGIVERDEDRPMLIPLDSPCGDCAVTCGYYKEISDALRREDLITQGLVSGKWFCHNNSQRACRGNLNNIGLELL